MSIAYFSFFEMTEWHTKETKLSSLSDPSLRINDIAMGFKIRDTVFTIEIHRRAGKTGVRATSYINVLWQLYVYKADNCNVVIYKTSLGSENILKHLVVRGCKV